MTKMLDVRVRDWGVYEVLVAEPTYQVRRLLIEAGHHLDRQVHRWKNELWMVVEGDATVWTDDERGTRTLGLGEIDFALKGVRHQIANLGGRQTVIIETQWGDPVQDEDVERFPGKVPDAG